MPDRRTFLQRAAALPLIGGLLPKGAVLQAASKKRDYFAELGVRTFINAAGTYTALTASMMPKEVMEAIQYASKHYVPLSELHDKVGERIASMIGSEAAMVTSGAAGAMMVGTAGCLTGTDRKAIQQLPDLTGLKSEVIIQKSHRFGYDHAVRACGVKLIEVETAEDLERAASDRTAMMLFYNNNDSVGKIKREVFIALGKKHKIPTFNDAAADAPPVENLSKYIKMGFDLVAFSGGKGIRGPQSAGLLFGRKDLIQAARMNTSPNGDTIARGLKINKEEMLGMFVALELFMNRDHQAQWKEWERRVKVIADSVRGLPTVTTETWVPEVANNVPHLRIKWNQSEIKHTPPAVLKLLREGKPSIEANPATDSESLVLGVWMMEPGEEQIVARRVREILKAS
jgi:D-glucosaminate-6-phosphate ammonia-lyase